MKHIHFRISDELYIKLNNISKERGIAQAELIRQILSEYISINHANDSLEIITSILRSVVRTELKPTENRMAKLSAKSAIAGATSMFLCTQTIADLGKHDSVEIYQKARKKAVAYMKEKE